MLANWICRPPLDKILANLPLHRTSEPPNVADKKRCLSCTSQTLAECAVAAGCRVCGGHIAQFETNVRAAQLRCAFPMLRFNPRWCTQSWRQCIPKWLSHLDVSRRYMSLFFRTTTPRTSVRREELEAEFAQPLASIRRIQHAERRQTAMLQQSCITSGSQGRQLRCRASEIQKNAKCMVSCVPAVESARYMCGTNVISSLGCLLRAHRGSPLRSVAYICS